MELGMACSLRLVLNGDIHIFQNMGLLKQVDLLRANLSKEDFVELLPGRLIQAAEASAQVWKCGSDERIRAIS
jgi:hypothetical protein